MVEDNGIDYTVDAFLCRACEARDIRARDTAEAHEGRGMAGLYFVTSEVMNGHG